jgi:hypothetical protein
MTTYDNWIDMKNSSNVIIEKCTFYDSRVYDAISMHNAIYAKILNNVFNSGTCTGNEIPTPIKACPGNFISTSQTKYSLFEGNTFNKVAHVTLGLDWGSTFNVVRNNIVNNEYHSGMEVYGTYADARNLFENNIIKNSGADYIHNPEPVSRDAREEQNGFQIGNGACNTIIRKNLFRNNGKSIVLAAWGKEQVAQNNKIYQNTIDDSYWGVSNDGDGTITGNIYKNNSITNTQIANRSITAWNYDIDPSERVALSINVNYFINNNSYGQSNYYKRSGGSIAVIALDWPAEFIRDGYAGQQMSADPKFKDPNNFDYTLQSSSPNIDSGAFLTTISSSPGTGQTFIVTDAGYFTDGWGIIEGDAIQLQNQTTTAKITNINYSTNSITVDKNLTWTNGQGVALAYSGSAPDIGAKEYFSGGDTTPPSPPDGLCVR